MGRKYIWVEFCVKIFTYLILCEKLFRKSHVSEIWPKIAQKNPKNAQNFKKNRKSPEKAEKSPNFFVSFSSGLFKTNFGVHRHFFY